MAEVECCTEDPSQKMCLAALAYTIIALLKAKGIHGTENDRVDPGWSHDSIWGESRERRERIEVVLEEPLSSIHEGMSENDSHLPQLSVRCEGVLFCFCREGWQVEKGNDVDETVDEIGFSEPTQRFTPGGRPIIRSSCAVRTARMFVFIDACIAWRISRRAAS